MLCPAQMCILAELEHGSCYRSDSRKSSWDAGILRSHAAVAAFIACIQQYLSKSSDDLAVLWFDAQRMRKVALALFCCQTHPVCSIRKHDQQTEVLAWHALMPCH